MFCLDIYQKFSTQICVLSKKICHVKYVEKFIAIGQQKADHNIIQNNIIV